MFASVKAYIGSFRPALPTLLILLGSVSSLAAQEGGARSAPAAAAGEQTKLPVTDAGRCVTAFLDMIADPVPERVSAFEKKYRSSKRAGEVSMEARIARAREMRERLGRLVLHEVVSVSESNISIVAHNERGEAISLEFGFDADEPGRLSGIRVSAGMGGGRPAPLTTPQRSELVESVAKAVSENYVYPEIGGKMAEAIRGKLKSGDYDRFDNDAALSQRLTEDMREISKDRHLGVRPEPRDAGRPHDGPGVDEIAGDNFAFRKVEVLPGNIGYLQFDAFVEDPRAYETVTAAFGFLAHCDALIFDLRHNGGGDPNSIRFITSYLFDKPAHLNDMVDRAGKVVEEYWTLESVPGPRFANDLPVFVLTSSYTFSGAEEFCYNLQNLKRATVVGEKSGGGAHPVMGVRVSDRVVVGVPFMRACNPISKTNWEGVGIQPDVSAPADAALDRAVELARAAIQARSSAAKK